MATVETNTLPEIRIEYGITVADIEATKAKYAALTADTPEGYKKVSLALREVVSTRTAIEKRRKELKEDALAYGRKVDAMARDFTNLILEIEEPLKAKKKAVDDEKTRAEREAAEAAKRAEEERLAAERAELERLRELERQRQEQERIADQERFRAEQAALAEARAIFEAQQRKAAEEFAETQRKLDAERRAIEQQRREAEAAARIAEQAEIDRLAAIEAHREAERLAEEEAALEKAVEESIEASEAVGFERSIENGTAIILDAEAIRAWGAVVKAASIVKRDAFETDHAYQMCRDARCEIVTVLDKLINETTKEV